MGANASQIVAHVKRPTIFGTYVARDLCGQPLSAFTAFKVQNLDHGTNVTETSQCSTGKGPSRTCHHTFRWYRLCFDGRSLHSTDAAIRRNQEGTFQCPVVLSPGRLL